MRLQKLKSFYIETFMCVQKQPFRGVPRKRCSENMQQIYRRTSLPKCDFNKVALQQDTWLMYITI